MFLSHSPFLSPYTSSASVVTVIVSCFSVSQRLVISDLKTLSFFSVLCIFSCVVFDYSFCTFAQKNKTIVSVSLLLIFWYLSLFALTVSCTLRWPQVWCVLRYTHTHTNNHTANTEEPVWSPWTEVSSPRRVPAGRHLCPSRSKFHVHSLCGGHFSSWDSQVDCP